MSSSPGTCSVVALAGAPVCAGAVDTHGPWICRSADLAAQCTDPQINPLGRCQRGRVQDQRNTVRPIRVPGDRADDDHRHRQVGEHPQRIRSGTGQRLHRPGHHSGSPQQCLPPENGDGVLHVPPRRQAGQIDADDRAPERTQRRCRQRGPDPDATLPHIDQLLPRGQRTRQGGGPLAVHGHRVVQQPDQRRIGAVITEQMGGDAVRNPEGARQERPVHIVDEHQRAIDQRRAGQQPGTRGRRRRRRVGE